MFKPFFPISYESVPAWAEQNGRSEDDAYDRFVQFAALHAAASHPRFQKRLVLRGAAAMRLFYGLDRATGDLDVIDLTLPPTLHRKQAIEVEAAVEDALSAAMPKYFPDFDQRKDSLMDRVEIQVSPRRALVRFETVVLPGSPEVTVGVADLHFLIAEKMIAILTHHGHRRKNRSHDVADIAVMMILHGQAINAGRVAEYFYSRLQIDRHLQACKFDDILRGRIAAVHSGPPKTVFRNPMTFDACWELVAQLGQMIMTSSTSIFSRIDIINSSNE